MCYSVNYSHLIRALPVLVNFDLFSGSLNHSNGTIRIGSWSEVGERSNREIVSYRALRACMRKVWLLNGIGSQKSLLPFAIFP